MECPQTIPLLKRLHHLPALSLRGRQALRHPAHLSDSSGSDSSRGAPRQAVLSVDGKAGGGGWVVRLRCCGWVVSCRTLEAIAPWRRGKCLIGSTNRHQRRMHPWRCRTCQGFFVNQLFVKTTCLGKNLLCQTLPPEDVLHVGLRNRLQRITFRLYFLLLRGSPIIATIAISSRESKNPALARHLKRILLLKCTT